MRLAALACFVATTTIPAEAQFRGGGGWHHGAGPSTGLRPAWRGEPPSPPMRRRCPAPREGSVIGAIAGGLLGGQPGDPGPSPPPPVDGRDGPREC